jgi:hypothetical protein
MLFNLFEGLEAVFSGHVQIEKDEMGCRKFLRVCVDTSTEEIIHKLLAIAETEKMLRFKDFTNRLVHKKTVIVIIVSHKQDCFLLALLDHGILLGGKISTESNINKVPI